MNQATIPGQWARRPGLRGNVGRNVRRERGSTLLEFAVTIIILLMFLFGIIDFSRALYTYHFVAHAAREGSRYAIVRGSRCQLAAACPAQDSDIQTFVSGLASGIGIDKNSVEVTSTWAPPTYDGGGQQTVNCTADPSSGVFNTPGCLVQVSVTYPFKFILPFMPSSTCNVQVSGQPQPKTGNICMTSTSGMVISQ